MNNRLYTIQEVADILGVSTKTLRRWDQRGLLVPTRTAGNQRRYTREQIHEFKGQKSKTKIASSSKIEGKILQSEPFFKPQTPKEFKPVQSLPSILSGLPSNSFLKRHFLLGHNDGLAESSSIQESPLSGFRTSEVESVIVPVKRVSAFRIGFMITILVLTLSFAGSVVMTKLNVVAGLAQKKDQFAKFIANLPQINISIRPKDLSFAPQNNQAVLAAAEGGSDLILNINVPAFFSQIVGIGTAAVDPSAVLDIVSEDKGFLAPRMTEIQRDAIETPATGLFVYNTDTNHYVMYNGTEWQGLLSSIGDSTLGEAFTETGTSGNSLYFHGTGGGVGQLTAGAISGAQIYTLPNASGEISLLGQSISNAELVNSKITITPGTNMTGGGDVSLGSSVTLTLKDSIALAGTLDVAGLTTLAGAAALNGNIGLGDSIADAITFTGRIAEGSSIVPIGTTGTNDLGTLLLPWDNLYADNIFAAPAGVSGYWQRNDNALSPTNITDDLLLGATSTTSALVKFSGTSGTPSWINSGNVGIGTTSPFSKFDVAGNITISGSQGRLTREIDTSSLNLIGGAGKTSAAYIQVYGDDQSTSPGRIENIIKGTGIFRVATAPFGSSTQTDLFAITQAGNVGIGTTVPIGLLDVEGSATGVALVKINQTGVGDILTASQGGNFKFVIANSGNVGVFTRTPTAQLDITGSASLSANISLRGSGTAHTFNVLDNGTLNFQRSVGGSSFFSSLFLQADGNVGIGTTAPGSLLTLANDGWLSGMSTSSGVTNMFKINTQDQIQVGGSLSIDGSLIFPTDAGYVTAMDLPLTSAQAAGTANGYGFRIGSSTIMTIYGENDASGNLQRQSVGIGTTAPIGFLNVSGESVGKALVNLNYTGSGQNIFTASASGTTKFVIDGNGNVGIGTDSPLSKLDVNGSVAIGSYAGSTAAPANGLIVSGNVGIGTGTPTSFILEVGGNVGPSVGSTYDLGSSSRRWNNIYGVNANFTNLSTSLATISGTTTNDFLINSDNVTDDTEDATLSLSRGTGTAVQWKWNSTTKQLSTNSPSVAILPDSTIAFSGTAALMVNQIQNQDIFTASASGVTKFVINNAGNVGILNATPLAELDIAGSASLSGNLSLRTTGTHTFSLLDGSSLNFQRSVGGSSFSSSLFLQADGNVGIGTTVPGSLLTLANDGWLSGMSTSSGVTNMFKINTQDQIQVGASLNIDGSLIFPTDAGYVTAMDLPLTSAQAAGTANGYGFRIGNTNIMTIYGENDGASRAQRTGVGIGTTAPIGFLNVSGESVGKALVNLNYTGSGQNIFTASASGVTKFLIDASGNASMAGTLTVSTIKPPTGALSLQYKSGGDAWTTGITMLDNSGRVGIGLTAPSANLEVKGTSNNQLKISYDTTHYMTLSATSLGDGWISPSTGFTYFYDGTLTENVAIYNGATQAILFSSGGNSFFNGGNVGIGTTSPIGLLNVSGDPAGKALVNLNYTGSGQNIFTASASGVTKFIIDGTGNVGMGGQTSPLAQLDITGSASLSGNLSLRTTGTHTFSLLDGSSLNFQRSVGGSSFSSSLFLQADGNVGIGTTVPGSLLTLANDGWLSGMSTSSGVTNMFKINTQDQIQVGASLSIDGSLIFPTDAGYVTAMDLPLTSAQAAGTANGYTFGIGSDNIMTIYGENNGSGSLQNGRVGIGTTAPLAKLDVRGNLGTITAASISATSSFAAMVVDNSGVGDLFTASKSGATKFVITNAGNVGLSVSNPSSFLLQTAGSIGPNADNLYDLGSASLQWRNIYANNIFAPVTGTSGYWQRNSNALSPTNITDDLLLGATSTTSAKFAFLNVAGGSPTASISGNLSLIVPTTAGANTFNLLNNSSLNFQRSVGGDAGLTSSLFIQADGNGNVGIGTTNPLYKLDIAGVTRTNDLITHDISIASSSANILSAFTGFSGYTNFSGGIGTGGSDSILSAKRLTSTGNLVNIGSIQGGETLLTKSGIFGAKTSYTIGTNGFATIGDLNGDGKPDIAVANSTVVSVRMNNGNGTFAANVDYAAGTSPQALAIGDLNGDGKADIAVADTGADTVSVLMNKGNGTFAAKADYSAGTQPVYIAIGDVNGDGNADLAVVNDASANSISIFTNNGDGTFAARVNYTTGTGPATLAMGDLNGDGRTDIAVANTTAGSVSVFINRPTGTFASKIDYTTNTTPHSVAIADVSGDGKADMVVTNTGSTNVSVFVGRGDGSFAAKVDYGTGTNPNSVAIGDLNGDGKPDMVVTNPGSNTVSVLMNNGDGTFATRVDYAASNGPASLAIGDLNGDGKADLAVTNSSFPSVDVYLNTTNPILYAQAATGFLGVGTTSPISQLHVTRSLSASASGKALVVFDQIESQDIFTASASGVTKFVIASDGNVGIGTATPTSFLLQTAGSIGPNADNQYDLGSASLQWRNIYANNIFAPVTGTSGYWQRNSGALSPTNITDDLLLGATSTTSAKFAFLNVAGGSPTASISSNLSLIVPTGSNPAATFNILNGGSLNFQRSVGGDGGLATSLFIQNNGNIGIGTTAPGSLLTLANDGWLSGMSTSSGVVNMIKVNTADQIQLGGSLNIDGSLNFPADGGYITATDMQLTSVPTAGTANGYTFRIGNTNVMTVYGENNGSTKAQRTGIGIGTTAPIGFLNVSGQSVGKALVNLNYTGSGQNIFTASASGVTKFVINSSGNIGAGGQTTPLTALDVTGSASLSANLSLSGSGTAHTFNILDNGTLNFATSVGGDAVTNSTLFISKGSAAGSGRVGIGMTAPAAALEVNVNDSSGVQIIAENLAVDGTGGIAVQNDARQWILRVQGDTSDQFQIRDVTAGLQRLVIDTSGNVGIGTTAPLAALDVRGNLGTVPAASVSALSSFAAMIVDNSGVGDLFTASKSGETKFVIHNNGNVGIGTASASKPFVVHSAISGNIAKLVSSTSQNAQLGFQVTGASGGVWSIGTSGSTGTIGPVGGFHIRDEVIGSGGGIAKTRFVIDTSGNVGIGTTAPLSALDVRGGLGTVPAASVSALSSFAAMIVDNSGLGDLFTASKSGATKFVITNAGNVGLSVSNPSSFLLQTAGSIGPNADNQYDLGSASLQWRNIYANNIFAPVTGTSGYWQRNSGALSPTNITDDLLLGATSTGSAKFAFLNVAGGNPTASISSNLSLVVPTGNGPASTLNILNNGSLNIQRSVGGDGTTSTALYIENTGNVGIGTTAPGAEFVTIGAIHWGATSGVEPNQLNNDQGGSIELGGTSSLANPTTGGMPYVDFHFGTGSAQDFNARISNADDNRLDFTTATGGVGLSINAGNVGLGGQTSPLAQLDVTGSASLSANISLRGQDTAHLFDILDGGSLNIRNSPGGSAQTTALFIKQNGNVGIGNTAPNTFKLETTGSIGPSANTSYDLGSSSKLWSMIYGNDVRANLFKIPGGTKAYMATSTNDMVIGSDSAGAAAMVNVLFRNSGNVGIGVTDPSSFLLQTAGSIGPNADNQYDLGSASLQWRNIYANNIFAPVTGTSGYWQRASAALSPTNITDDLLLGATSTTSAKFAFLNVAGGTPTASISANSGDNATFLTGLGNLGTTNFQALTLGGSTTGNIFVNPRNGTAGGLFGPVTDNVTDLGASSSGRFRSLFLGPSSAHIQCTTGDGCGQGLDYALGINTTTGTFSIGLNGSTATGNPYFNITQGGYVGIGTTAPGSLLTLANDGWLSGMSTSSGVTNMFKINTQDQIQVGGSLSIDGSLIFPTDAGYVTAMDLPLTSAQAAGTANGYGFRIGSSTIMTIYGENDASGNLQRQSVGIGTTAPIGFLNVSGESVGKALVNLNYTGSGQNIFTASASGVTKFVVDASGNIGVGGQTTPLTALDVTGSASLSANLSLSGSGTAHTFNILDNGTLNFTTSVGGDAVTNSTLFISKGSAAGKGNVGIGTTNPGRSLDVNGYIRTATATTGGFVWGADTTRLREISGGVLALDQFSTNNTVSLRMEYSSSIYGTLGPVNSTGDFTISTTGGSSGHIILQPIGNVGIGTTSPLARLDVRGNLGTVPAASVSGITSFAAFLVDNSGVGDLFTASKSGAMKFVITNAGNVGIGTAMPGTLLSLANNGWFSAASTQSGQTTNMFKLNTQDQIEVGASLSIDGSLIFPTDAGYVVAADLSLTSAQTAGTANGYIFGIGQKNILTIYGENNGSGVVQNGRVGIGTTAPLSALDVRGGLGTVPAASVSAVSSFAAMIVDNSGVGDLFTASKSGATKFVITNAGNVGIGGATGSQVLDVTGAVQSSTVFLGGLGDATNPTFSFTGDTNTGMYRNASDQIGITAGGALKFTLDTAAFRGVAGTTTAPGISFTGDANTGIYNETDLLGFATGGVSRMVINSSGNVGIGAGSPLAALDVRGNLGTVPVASISGVTSFAAMIVDNSGVGDLFTASKSGAMKFVITNAGNVGIGVSMPGSLLSLANNGWFSAASTQSGQTINMFKVNTQDQIEVGASLSIDGSLIFPTDAGYVTAADLPLTSAQAAGTANGYTFGIGNTNIMTIYGENDGASRAQRTGVGIGTTAPIGFLNVSGESVGKALVNLNYTGNGQNIFTASASGVTKFVIDASGNIGVGGRTIPIEALDVLGNASMSGTLTVSTIRPPTGALNLQYKSGPNAWTNALTIADNSGYVGIGTTDVAAPLHVLKNRTNGSIYEQMLIDGDTMSSTVAGSGLYIGFRGASDGYSGAIGSYANGDEGMGIWAGSSISGAPEFFVQDTGNVGIGTTTPLALLDVAGNASMSGSLSIRTTGTHTFSLLDGSSLNFQRSVGGSSFSSSLFLQADGNVGIGTTAPGSLLTLANDGWLSGMSTSSGVTNMFKINTQDQIQVGGSLSIDGSLIFPTDAGYVTAMDLPLTSAQAAGTANGYGFRIGNTNIMTIYGENDGASRAQRTGVGIGTTAPIGFLNVSGESVGKALVNLNYTGNGQNIFTASASGVTKFTINSSGNVGFGGQTTPLTALDVTGSASLSANISLSGSGTAHTFNILDNGTLNFTTSVGGDAVTNPTLFIKNGSAAGSGNVGIGTTAPTSKLHVNGALTIAENNYITWADANTFIEQSTDALYLKALQNIRFYSGYSGDWLERMTILASSGNVGIGTASPIGLLNVSGAPVGKALVNLNYTGNGQNIFTASASGVTKFLIDASGNASMAGTLTVSTIKPPTGALSLQYKSGGDAWTTALTLKDNNGFVGIGTTAPTEELTIGAGGKLAVYRSGDDRRGVFYTDSNGTYLESDSNGSDPLTLKSPGTSGSIRFNTSSSEQMRITTAGNVGIGTTTPLARLDVRGNLGTVPVASISGVTSFAAMIVDNSGVGDLFTASKSGAMKFVITNAGNVGIGVSMPGSLLSLANNGWFSGASTQSGQTTNMFKVNTQDQIEVGASLSIDGSFNFPTDAGYVTAMDLPMLSAGNGTTSGYTFRMGTANIMTIYGENSSGTLANGRVGIGTTAPSLRLDVQDSQDATAAAQIYNTSTNAGADGLIVKLGNTSTSVVAATNHFLSFETVGIGIVGSIQGSGGTGVTYATSGIADFAEYFKKDKNTSIPFGSVVCFDDSGLAVACDNNSNKIIGVASERPAFLGGENLGDRSVPVGLVGQVKTRVSTANGAIKIGDPLTTSSTAGIAVKATQTGQILGKAIQPFDGAQGQEGNILVSVNISWYNPSIYVSYDGTLAGMATTVGSIGDQLTLQGQQLALQGDASSSLSLRADGLQAQMASNSARLSTLEATKTDYILATDPLFDSLNNKVMDLESKINLLTAQVEQQASASAFLTEILNSQVLGASTSADLELGDIEVDNLTVNEDFMVLGRTTVTDLGVTGNINAGVLAIHGLDGEINTLSGDLKLQSNGLAGVDILNGKVVIDTKGNVTVAGTVTADAVEANSYTVLGDQTIGSATIPAGATSIEILTSAASVSSKIFLTSTSLTSQQITVVKKSIGKFKVAIPSPTTSPISFDWWIVGTK